MRRLLLIVGLLAIAAGGAAAQDYPTRPVRIIVPYAAGGSSDVAARPYAEKLSQALGQQFVVENRGGAAGALGAELVAKSPPDGYTLLLAGSAPFTALPHLRKLPFDPVKDLVPVARTGETVGAMAVHPSLGVDTLKDFIALAKAKPGQIAFGSAGVASVTHLRGEMLAYLAQINLTHVPYRGNGEAIADLLAGNIQVMFEVIVLPYHKTGKLKALALLADERSPDYPDVPTMKEAGLPEYNVPVWYAIYAPGATPEPILAKLHATVTAISQDADMRARMRQVSFVLPHESREALRAIVADESERFGRLIKAAHITME